MNLARYYPGSAAAARAGRRARLHLQRARPAAPRADAPRDRGELRRAGQHVDRHGADLAGARPSRPLAHRDRLLAHVPSAGHVRLHDPARPARRPARPRAGDVSGRRRRRSSARCLVTFTDAFWSVTLGTFLVGLGWAAANVAATALIADQSDDGAPRPGDRRQRQLRRRDRGADGGRDRSADRLVRPAGRRPHGGGDRGGAAGDAHRPPHGQMKATANRRPHEGGARQSSYSPTGSVESSEAAS